MQSLPQVCGPRGDGELLASGTRAGVPSTNLILSAITHAPPPLWSCPQIPMRQNVGLWPRRLSWITSPIVISRHEGIWARLRSLMVGLWAMGKLAECSWGWAYGAGRGTPCVASVILPMLWGASGRYLCLGCGELHWDRSCRMDPELSTAFGGLDPQTVSWTEDDCHRFITYEQN